MTDWSALGDSLLPDATGGDAGVLERVTAGRIRRISFLPKVSQEEVNILAELIKVSLMAPGQTSTAPTTAQSSDQASGKAGAKTADNEAVSAQDVW